MSVIDYVQATTLEKDRENLVKTQETVLRHFEHGDPLVDKFEEKIAKYCERYDITRGEVLASILTDRVAATKFAKSASRQGTAEKAQFEYLRTVRGIDVERLKKSGPDCIRLWNGEMHTGLPKMPTATKSLDGKYKNDYIFFKWTDGEGGHQDYAGFDDSAPFWPGCSFCVVCRYAGQAYRGQFQEPGDHIRVL